MRALLLLVAGAWASDLAYPTPPNPFAAAPAQPPPPEDQPVIKGAERIRPRWRPSVKPLLCLGVLGLACVKEVPQETSLLAAFDAPSGFSSASERLNTTTSTQALLLRNNPWPHARARAMAKKFSTHGTLESSIGGIFKAAYGRPPAQAEIELARSFLDQLMAKSAKQAKGKSPPTRLG